MTIRRDPDSETPGRAALLKGRITLARVYDEATDGTYRVLVDRLWPRGMSKEDADLDEWLKDAAPSSGLRRWYGHQTEKFAEFTLRYQAELAKPPTVHAVERLRDMAGTRELVLLTATRDVQHSGAKVLFDHLDGLDREV